MRSAQHSYKKFPRVKYWVILSFIIGIVTYVLATEFIPKSFTISEVNLNGRGGTCPFGIYDKAGVVHSIFIDIVSYVGPAPLYYLDPEKIGAKKDDFLGCYDFPQQIQPSLVSDEVTFYPLDVNISFLNDNWIGAGESTILSVDAKFSDSYSENSFALPIAEGEERETTYELYATNFEFSPSKENTPPATLSLNYPIKQQWIISPKNNALGEQYLGVSVIVDKHILPIILKIDVRPLYGLNPTMLGLIAAFGSGIIGLLTIISQTLGVWEKLGQLRNKGVGKNEYGSNDKLKENDDPWISLSYRQAKIQQARERELLERKLNRKK